MNSNPEYAKTQLSSASLAKSRAQTTVWVTSIAGLLILIILGVALADYQWLLPRWARFAGFALLLLLALAGLARLVWLWRRPATLKEVALDAEARDRNLGCTISTAAEYLSGERQVRHEYEPKLVAALETQAGAMLSTVKVPYWRSLLPPALLCLAGFLVFLGFLLCASGSITALLRAAVPWTSAAYTQVEVKPGDAEIAAGTDFAIDSRFRGRPPADAQFQWKTAGAGSWQAARLTKTTNDHYAYLIKDARQELTYRVAGGDAASPDYRLTVYIPAEVKELAVRVEYPAYTGLKPAFQKSGDLTAVRGSTVGFTLTPNVPLSQAKLSGDKISGLAFSPGASNTWAGSLLLTTNTAYRIALWDAKNRPGVPGQTNRIKVLPDEPPKVEILEPAQDMRADATNAIAIKATAADDFGVAELKLVYHKLGEPEQTLPLQRLSGSNREVTATNTLLLTPLGLKPYELVSYYVEARDNNTLDGPGIGRSPVFFIEITDLEGCKCKPKKPMASLNLLVIQKQIIADTRALADHPPTEHFTGFAAREDDAAGFGQIYLGSMVSNGAPQAAIDLMQAALVNMTNATQALKAKQRAAALPPEEQALANFYQILKLLPELQNLPLQQPPTNALATAQTNPPPSQMLKVVLKAIDKPPKETPDDQALEEMLEETQQLSQNQTSINHLTSKPSKSKAKAGSNASGRQAKSADDQGAKAENAAENPDAKESQAEQAQAAKQADGKNPNAQNAQAQNGQEGASGKSEKASQDGKDGKDGQMAKSGKSGKHGEASKPGQKGQKGQKGKNGKGSKGQGGKGGEAKDAQGQGGQPGSGKAGDPEKTDVEKSDGEKAGQPEDAEPPAEELAKAAEQEEALSQEAAELVAKLERAAGKDTRLGHGLSKAMKNAAASMTSAAQSLKSGDRPGGNTHGSQAVKNLNAVAALLQ